jgi:hypothetical protein
MAVLCDWQIMARCRKSEMVVPFDEELVNPASLDVLLGDHLMVESIYSPELVRVDISHRTEDDPFMLHPGEVCLAETRESFNLPTDLKPCSLFLWSHACWLVRSRLARIKADAGVEERAFASRTALIPRTEDWADGFPSDVRGADEALRP